MTAIDAMSQVARAKIHNRGNALAADDMTGDRILPLFETNGLPFHSPCSSSNSFFMT